METAAVLPAIIEQAEEGELDEAALAELPAPVAQPRKSVQPSRLRCMRAAD
jgi:hypothetical protein